MEGQGGEERMRERRKERAAGTWRCLVYNAKKECNRARLWARVLQGETVRTVWEGGREGGREGGGERGR
jgi:hypothetical protein